MLVITTGPTGSGKTTLALSVAAKHHWNVVRTLTTRPTRVVDTKQHVSQSEMSAILAAGTHRRYEYAGHAYATPLDVIREAASSPDSVSVVDWVHPHPEDLSRLGPHAVGAVLLPPPEALAERLVAAGRPDRVTRALREHGDISARLAEYRGPWFVIAGDLSLETVEARLLQIVCDWAHRR